MAMNSMAIAQGWTRLYIRQLPDTSFALIENNAFGKKFRHCPYRNINGEISVEQLIYCMGTLDRETWTDPDNKWIAKKIMEKEYQRWRNTLDAQEIPSVAVNSAPLSELVRLPHIGPALAVNIAEYRESHDMFATFNDIGKVKGIGQGTLNAIRFYITID
jgi:competence protein ComEA